MNPNAKNLPEFKKLIERYETITIEEINEEWGDYDASLSVSTEPLPQNKLTGYGTTTTCTLCQAVEAECCFCVHPGFISCVDDKTYDDIGEAASPEELLKAYRARAKYMRTLIEK